MDSSQITDFESAAAYVRESGHSNIKVAVTDIDGILRGKYVSRNKFLSALEKGFGFCDVIFGWDCADASYDNTKLTGWHTGYPDAKVKLDLSTYRTVPWDGGVPLFLGEFVDKKIPWVHVDLSACMHKGGLAHVPSDINGFGVRYTMNLLLDQQILEA